MVKPLRQEFVRGIRNRDSDVLPLVQGQRFERPENAIFIDCRERLRRHSLMIPLNVRPADYADILRKSAWFALRSQRSASPRNTYSRVIAHVKDLIEQRPTDHWGKHASTSTRKAIARRTAAITALSVAAPLASGIHKIRPNRHPRPPGRPNQHVGRRLSAETASSE